MLKWILNYIWPISAWVVSLEAELLTRPENFKLLRLTPSPLGEGELDLFTVKAVGGEQSNFHTVLTETDFGQVEVTTLSDVKLPMNWREEDTLFDALDTWKLNWLMANFQRATLSAKP